jgi:hypothetical protein
MRLDRRNPSLATSRVRRLLSAELPELPRELAERADPLTLCFLVASLLQEPTHECPPDAR